MNMSRNEMLRFENIDAQMVKELASKTSDEAGNGRATAVEEGIVPGGGVAYLFQELLANGSLKRVKG